MFQFAISHFFEIKGGQQFKSEILIKSLNVYFLCGFLRRGLENTVHLHSIYDKIPLLTLPSNPFCPEIS